ncbi:M20 family metallo-hydrolase [Cecembia rubra]|uniref:Acetylornithine deacetylase n=1 Tax=Cecembia rubra TaxID=1485585 RepID=A0A2P8DYL2_9BACT|nr:M20 family metallo-hydrolase [Cecembia rubra]PSL02295.1 acetylornithine deacetylase [Cecembia rubra]
MGNLIQEISEEAILLLKSLIEIPSLSKEENKTADLIQGFLESKAVVTHRKGNNVWAFSKNQLENQPYILLNSHHDTVKPNAGYTKDPFQAIQENGKLFGLGSNDAGGCLVSLIATFLYFQNRNLPFNLVVAATAEEEISGKNGIECILPELPAFELAIVGEPTLMQMAVAEKGLLVIDATVKGKAGHAAREEGDNAIYKALEDLNVIRNYQFQKTSPFLGKSKVTATIIQAGTQHNVIPDLCQYTLDARITDAYTLEEALEELKTVLKAELLPRSLRLNSSKVPIGHKILEVGEILNLTKYGSPTLSDQALIPYPSVKIGPGDSARSHTPDEFIYLNEIHEGIKGYIQILETYAALS